MAYSVPSRRPYSRRAVSISAIRCFGVVVRSPARRHNSASVKPRASRAARMFAPRSVATRRFNVTTGVGPEAFSIAKRPRWRRTTCSMPCSSRKRVTSTLTLLEQLPEQRTHLTLTTRSGPGNARCPRDPTLGRGDPKEPIPAEATPVHRDSLLTGHAVAITIESRTVPGLTPVQGSCSGRPSFGAVGERRRGCHCLRGGRRWRGRRRCRQGWERGRRHDGARGRIRKRRSHVASMTHVRRARGTRAQGDGRRRKYDCAEDSRTHEPFPPTSRLPGARLRARRRPTPSSQVGYGATRA